MGIAFPHTGCEDQKFFSSVQIHECLPGLPQLVRQSATWECTVDTSLWPMLLFTNSTLGPYMFITQMPAGEYTIKYDTKYN